MPARRPRIPLPARQQYSLNRSLFYAVIVKIGYCSAVAGVFTNFPIKSQSLDSRHYSEIRARAGESFPYIAANEKVSPTLRRMNMRWPSEKEGSGACS